MTVKSRKFCRSFPCKNLALPGSGYCREHQGNQTVKEADPFYLSKEWRRFREWYLTQHPFCEECEKEGRLNRATLVHHIVEIKDGGALLSEENSQALCRDCHGKAHKSLKNHQKPSACNRRGAQKILTLGEAKLG